MLISPRRAIACLSASSGLALSVALAAMPAPAAAQVLPVVEAGGDGGATITPAAGTLTVDLNNANRVVRWNSFDVGAGGTVNFRANDTASRLAILNRVGGSNNASDINGAVNSQSNIAVWLINPSGIFFGSGGSFNGGSLLLSTMGLHASFTEADFLDGAGTPRFAGSSAAAIALTGAGDIATTDGSFVAIGQDIAVAKRVTATGGDIALVAARDVSFPVGLGSPLAITVNAGTTLATARIAADGTLTGSSVRIAGASQTAAIAKLLNVGANAVLTASAQDGTIVLATASLPDAQVEVAGPQGLTGIRSLGVLAATGSGGATMAASGDIVIETNAPLRLGDITAGRSLAIRSRALGGTLEAGNLTAGEDIGIMARYVGELTVEAPIDVAVAAMAAGDDISVSATGNVNIGSAITDATGPDTRSINFNTNPVSFATLQDDANIRIDAGGSVSLGTAITSGETGGSEIGNRGGDIRITAGQSVGLGSLAARRSVWITTAQGDIGGTDGSIGAGGDIAIDSGRNVTLGTANAGGSVAIRTLVSLAGGNVEAGTLIAGQDVGIGGRYAVEYRDNTVTVGVIQAGDDVDVSAAGDVTLGVISTDASGFDGRRINLATTPITFPSGLDGNANILSTFPSVVDDHANVRVESGGLATIGSAAVSGQTAGNRGGDIWISGRNGVALGSLATEHGSVRVHSSLGKIGGAEARIVAGEDIGVASGWLSADAVRLASAQAGDDIDILADGGIRLGTVTADASGPDDRRIDLASPAGGFVAGESPGRTGSNINVESRFSGAEITQGSLTGNGGVVSDDPAYLAIKADGDIRIGALSAANGDIVVTSAKGDVNGLALDAPLADGRLLSSYGHADLAVLADSRTIGITADKGTVQLGIVAAGTTDGAVDGSQIAIAAGAIEIVRGSARNGDVALAATTGDIAIKDHLWANRNVALDAAADVRIGDYVSAADGTPVSGYVESRREDVAILAGDDVAGYVGSDTASAVRGIGAVLASGNIIVDRFPDAGVPAGFAGADVGDVRVDYLAAGGNITIDIAGSLTGTRGGGPVTGGAVLARGDVAIAAFDSPNVNVNLVRLNTVKSSEGRVSISADDIAIGNLQTPGQAALAGRTYVQNRFYPGNFDTSDPLVYDSPDYLLSFTNRMANANPGSVTLTDELEAGYGKTRLHAGFFAEVAPGYIDAFVGDNAQLRDVVARSWIDIAADGITIADTDNVVGSVSNIADPLRDPEPALRLTASEGTLHIEGGSIAGLAQVYKREGSVGTPGDELRILRARNDAGGFDATRDTAIASDTHVRLGAVATQGNLSVVARDGDVTGLRMTAPPGVPADPLLPLAAGFGEAGLTAGPAAAGAPSIVVRAEQGIAQLGDVFAGNAVSVQARALSAVTARAALGQLTLTATQGPIVLGTGQAGGDARLESSADIRADSVSAGSDAILLAPDGAVTGRGANARTGLAAGKSVAVTSGGLARLGQVTAGNAVVITAGDPASPSRDGSIDVGDIAAAAGDVRLTAFNDTSAPGGIVAASATAGGGIVINAGGGDIGTVAVNGDLAARDDITVDATGGATLRGNITAASGGVRIDASDVTLGMAFAGDRTIAGAGAVTITAQGGVTQAADGAGASGLLIIRSNTDGAGAETLAVTARSGKIGLKNSALVGGSAGGRESPVELRAAAGTIDFKAVDASALLVRSGGQVTGTGAVNAGNAARAADPVGGFATIDIAAAADGVALADAQAHGAGHDIAISAPGAITANTLTAARDLTAGGGGIAIGTAEAGRSAMLKASGAGGDVTVARSLTAGTAATIDAAGLARLGAVTAQTVTIAADDADLRGDIGAGIIEIINRSPTADPLLLGSVADGASAGFGLNEAEFNRLNAATIVIGPGTHDVRIGDLKIDGTTGTGNIDILASGRRVDIVGWLRDSSVGDTGTVDAAAGVPLRTVRLGGSAADGDRASVLTVAATAEPGLGNEDGRILLPSAEVDLRADYIGVGQKPGFLDALNLTSGTPLAVGTVTSDFVSNAESSLYFAENNGGSRYSPEQQVLISAGRLRVRYDKYALFQNTGAGDSAGVVLTGMQDGGGVLDVIAAPQTFALFGTILGRRDAAAALLDPPILSFQDGGGGRNSGPATLINGCVVGQVGGGCLVNTANPPVIGVFDPTRADIFKTSQDFEYPFDPVIGTNNESLFGEVGTLGLEDIPVATPPRCDDEGGVPCVAPEGQGQ